MPVDYNKYQKMILKYSYNGAIWAPVQPYQYKKGEVIEANSYDCGYKDPVYRMVQLPSSDYYCINQSKYYKLRQQVSYDDGITWEDVTPYVEEVGDIMEPNSYDCDYGVTWEPVPNEYYCKLAIVPINYCNSNSNCPSTMYFEGQEITNELTIPSKISSDARTFEHNNVIFRTDGYLAAIDTNGQILYNGWIQNPLAIESTYLCKYITNESYVKYNVLNIVGDELYFYLLCNRNNYYYWNVSKVNFKTGMFSVLYDSGEPSRTIPWQTTSSEANIMSDRNYLYTDGTCIYKVTSVHYSGYTKTGTILKKWDFSANSYSDKELKAIHGNNGEASVSLFTQTNSHPGIFYLFEDYKDSSKTSGVIYKYDFSTNGVFNEFGVWFNNLDLINTSECLPSGGNYEYSRYYSTGEIEQLFYFGTNISDTPLMPIKRTLAGTIVNSSIYYYNGENSFPHALIISNNHYLYRNSETQYNIINRYPIIEEA